MNIFTYLKNSNPSFELLLGEGSSTGVYGVVSISNFPNEDS
jgi:hypothetical protein